VCSLCAKTTSGAQHLSIMVGAAVKCASPKIAMAGSLGAKTTSGAMVGDHGNYMLSLAGSSSVWYFRLDMASGYVRLRHMLFL